MGGIAVNLTQHKMIRFLWNNGDSPAKEIGKGLKVDASTISRNLRNLVKEEFVVVTGELDAGPYGGRKAKVYGLNPGKYAVLGIGLEQSEVAVAKLNLRGEVIEKGHWVREIRKDEIVDVIAKLSKEYGNDEELLGIGVAMPGIMDVDLGVIIYSAAFELRDYDLKERLRERTGKDFFLMNDANAAAAAFSHRWRNLEYFLISIPYNLDRSVGMGVGLWLEGKSYLGSSMSAGEFRVGALPPLVSETDKVRTLKELKKYDSLRLEDIKEFLKRLVELIEDTIYMLDPDGVVIGGDVNLLPREVHDYLRSELEKGLMEKPRSFTEIIIDEEGLETVAIGVAKAFLNCFFNNYDFAIEILKGR